MGGDHVVSVGLSLLGQGTLWGYWVNLHTLRQQRVEGILEALQTPRCPGYSRQPQVVHIHPIVSVCISCLPRLVSICPCMLRDRNFGGAFGSKFTLFVVSCPFVGDVVAYALSLCSTLSLTSSHR